MFSTESGGGGFDRPGVEQQLRQLAQTVIRIRQAAAMGILWELIATRLRIVQDLRHA